jgi:hypothetical protein
MIPLVGYLIIISSAANITTTTTTANKNNNQNNNSSGNTSSSSTITKRLGRNIIITNLRNLNLKALGLWFIPVILIPAIWPAYNILTGQFDDWLHGLSGWAGRVNSRGIFGSLNSILGIDPVLLSLSIAGIVFATVSKKDFIFLLWIIPFIIYFTAIGYVKVYYWIPLLPILCISAAILIEGISNKISNITHNNNNNKKIKNVVIVSQKILPYAIISAIAIFGLVSTTMLITTNVNSFYFQMYASIVQYLPDYNNNRDGNDDSGNNNGKVTIVGSQWVAGFSWIPNNVFSKDHDYRKFSKSTTVPTKNVLFVLDKNIKDTLSKSKKVPLRTFYKNSKTIATFKDTSDISRYNFNKYPYTSMKENRGVGRVEIRTNYE